MSFCTKGHNARFGCGKCLCEGDYLHKIVFLEENAPRRTDDNFRRHINEEYHTGVSPFERLPVNMIKSFPLDYMHLVCLGVTKRILLSWIKGKRNISRLHVADVENATKDLLYLRKYVPAEFARRPKSLEDIDRWKATELRLFLLYLGPIIMKKYLSANYYQNFVTLHVAIRILCHPTDCLQNNTYANELLTYFVRTTKELYGEDNLVYNIHNLIHLSDDVKIFGSLDTFSAFPFENYMQIIKRMLRKAEHPLSQLHNRITEIRNCPKLLQHSRTSRNNTPAPLLAKPDNKILPHNCINSHKEIHLKDIMLNTKQGNNCCYLKDGSVFTITYIGYKHDIPVVLGRIYRDFSRLEMYPCDSRDLKICIGKDQSDIQIIPVTDIDVKAFKVILHGIHYIMPILHI